MTLSNQEVFDILNNPESRVIPSGYVDGRIRLRRRKGKGRRYYDIADIDRLNEGWSTQLATAFSTLDQAIKKGRARARDLERNAHYARRLIGLLERNVIGPSGIRLIPNARDQEGLGPLDRTGNRKVKAAWTEWCKFGECTVDRKGCFRDLQKRVVRRVAVDGECFLMPIEGFGNRHRFAFQMLDADDIPENLTRPKERIYMGIEFDEFWAPVAYYVKDKEGEHLHPESQTRTRRIDASRIYHIFIQERPRQPRGITMLAASGPRMRMLDGIEEAVTVGMRVAASKVGGIKTDDGEYNTDDTVEPGELEIMGLNDDFVPFDVDYPPARYGEFFQSTLRGIAAGLDVGYNLLANDASDANYSSIRWLGLDERDVWRGLQQFVIEQFLDRFYPQWLMSGMLSGAIELPESRFRKFLSHRWLPRGWQWVDPEKESKGAARMLQLGVTSPRRIAANLGADFEEIQEEIEEDRDLIQSHSNQFVLDAMEGNSETARAIWQSQLDTETATASA